MQALIEVVREVARTDATVLIRGESGVGKNLVARAIHAASARRAGPFVLVNCAALPAELLESELFGHEKGAFTGAYRRKPGRFEFAGGGTLCLDEIGEMPRVLQAKLLHVLQDLEFSRVGGRELIRADVRVIATTNRDLEVAMRNGPVPRGPLLPAERHRDPRSAPARAPGGDPGAGSVLSGALQQPVRRARWPCRPRPWRS